MEAEGYWLTTVVSVCVFLSCASPAFPAEPSSSERDRVIEHTLQQLVAAKDNARPPSPPSGESSPARSWSLSGYAKSLNLWTRATGSNPDVATNPFAANEGGEDLFATDDRHRVKWRWHPNEYVTTAIDYNHELQGGSFVGRGDFDLLRQHRHQRQWLDLSQTLIDESGIFYEHGLYRAYVSLRLAFLHVDLGRQQIPWGVGRFVTPTDVFNPFDFTALELHERDGVDAMNLRTPLAGIADVNVIYTPQGRRLHPERLMARFSKDVVGYEVGLLGGRVGSREVVGYDVAGNIQQAVVRNELLFQAVERESDVLQYTANIDYNFANGLYALLEYHFNGQGQDEVSDYRTDQAILGEIQLRARHYVGAELGYDVTPLTRIESRSMVNLNDESLFSRLELRHSLRENLVLALAAIGVWGNATDEFGSKENAYFIEIQRFF